MVSWKLKLRVPLPQQQQQLGSIGSSSNGIVIIIKIMMPLLGLGFILVSRSGNNMFFGL